MSLTDRNRVVSKQDDCVVYVSKYVGGRGDTDLYEDDYWEIAQGLAMVTTSLEIEGGGTAEIRLSLPVDRSQVIAQVQDRVLIRHGRKSKGTGFTETEDVATVPTDRRKVSETNRAKIESVNIYGDTIAYHPVLDATKTKCLFEPMDKVKIWMTNRFQARDGDKQYSKAFEGLITARTVSFAGGSVDVVLTCEDLTKWLRISVFNVNPALDQETFKSVSGNRQISLFTTNLAGLTTGQIMQKMIVGERGEAKEITKAKYEKLAANNKNVEDGRIWKTTTGDITKYYKRTKSKQGVGYFVLAKKGSGKTEASGKVREISQDVSFDEESLWIDPNLDDFRAYTEMVKGSFELWVHQYKSRWDICQEVARIIEAELFMDPDGTLWFKPPYYNMNPGTYYLTDPDGKTTEKKYSVLNGDQYLIDDLDVVSYASTENDSQILTYLYVKGQVSFLGSRLPMPANTTIEYDADLMQRFGFRSEEKSLPIFGTPKDETARSAYGQGLLNRRNSRYDSMEMQILLRPELRHGRTVALMGDMIESVFKIREFNPTDDQDASIAQLVRSYLVASGIEYQPVTKRVKSEEARSAREKISNILVYYISGITHSWQPGAVCITSLRLTNGRYWENLFGKLKYIAKEESILDVADSFISNANEILSQFAGFIASSRSGLEKDFPDVKGISDSGDIEDRLEERGLNPGAAGYESAQSSLENSLAKRQKIQNSMQGEMIVRDICYASIRLYVLGRNEAPTVDEVATEVKSNSGYEAGRIDSVTATWASRLRLEAS